MAYFLALLLTLTSAKAQIGINTTSPDSSAILDIRSTTKGLLIPTMTTAQREALQANPPSTGLANGLLVFDSDLYQFFFFDTNVQKWVAINPWRKEYTETIGDAEHVTTDLNAASNVGVGTTSPSSKLTVNGNLSVGNTNTAAPANGVYVDGQVRIGAGSGTSEKLEVEGNANFTQTVYADKFDGKGIVPVGGIIMYSGSITGLFDASGLGISGTKMEGWAICNGNNGTPNLISKFVVGAKPGEPLNDGDYDYAVKEEGGENTHVLTVNEIPSHNHHVQGYTNYSTTGIGIEMEGGGDTGSDPELDEAAGNPDSYSATSVVHDPGHRHYINLDSQNTGGGQAHENRPPFYAVYYIMRIQ